MRAGDAVCVARVVEGAGLVAEWPGDLHTTGGQLLLSLDDVGDGQLEAVQRARLLLGEAGSEDDGALGAGRGHLHDPVTVVDREVGVETPAEPPHVEAHGTVHVGDGEDDDFELHVHGCVLAFNGSSQAYV